MSIASEITRLQTAKADIKAAIENKGVTVPSEATLDDYADYIDEISGGSGGIVITDTVDAAGGTIREITAQEISGTLSITQNGTHDVTQYASAEVNVSGGGGTLIESGTFTVATKSKNYDIVHNLGTAPNFCFIFPIDVHTDSDAYLIGSQTICSADFGQENWTIGTNATARPGGHAFGIGTGYSVSVHGLAGEGNALPFLSSATDLYYCGYFTDSIARVGNTNSNNGAGWLLGTYGYFLGVMPVATES